MCLLAPNMNTERFEWEITTTNDLNGKATTIHTSDSQEFTAGGFQCSVMLGDGISRGWHVANTSYHQLIQSVLIGCVKDGIATSTTGSCARYEQEGGGKGLQGFVGGSNSAQENTTTLSVTADTTKESYTIQARCLTKE